MIFQKKQFRGRPLTWQIGSGFSVMGGKRSEEGGAIGGKEREKKIKCKTERKRDCKKGIKHPFISTLEMKSLSNSACAT